MRLLQTDELSSATTAKADLVDILNYLKVDKENKIVLKDVHKLIREAVEFQGYLNTLEKNLKEIRLAGGVTAAEARALFRKTGLDKKVTGIKLALMTRASSVQNLNMVEKILTGQRFEVNSRLKSLTIELNHKIGALPSGKAIEALGRKLATVMEGFNNTTPGFYQLFLDTELANRLENSITRFTKDFKTTNFIGFLVKYCGVDTDDIGSYTTTDLVRDVTSPTIGVALAAKVDRTLNLVEDPNLASASLVEVENVISDLVMYTKIRNWVVLEIAKISESISLV